MKWFDRFRQATIHKNRAKPDLPNRENTIPQSPEPDVQQEEPSGNTSPLAMAPEATLNLSPREKEVFQFLIAGAKMKDIADKLGIKTSTVNGYCRQIYRRLGVNSKPQLILRYSDYWKKTEEPSGSQSLRD